MTPPDERGTSTARRRTLGTAARVLLGGGGIILGLLPAVTLPLDAPSADRASPDWRALLFAAVLILGGTLLVAVPRPLNVAGVGDVRAPGSVRGWVGGAAAGLVGLTVCAVLPLGHSCCDGAWTVTLGLPLPWTAGTGDTWGDALSQAWDDPWHPLAAAGDAICWAYAAMVVVMVAGLLRRAQRERFGARP